MKNIKFIGLGSITVSIYCCSEDRRVDTSEPETANEVIDTVEFITAGSHEYAYYKLVDDSISSTAMDNEPLNTETKEYDLNNDGKNDVSFTTVGSGGLGGWRVTSFFLPLDSNEVVRSQCYFTDLKSLWSPTPLEEDDLIDDQLNFAPFKVGSGEGLEISYDGSHSKLNCWENNVVQYIGVKITNTDAVEYAWIKAAVNTTPNKTTTYIKSFGSRQ